MMIGLAASIAIVVFLVCIVFIVYALRSRAARSHISILSLIIPIGKGLRWTTPKIIVSQPRSLRPAELR